MIPAVSEYLPVAFSSPPAIMQFYQAINNSITNGLLSDTFYLDKEQNIIFMLDKEIKTNINNYLGFENINNLFNNYKNDAILRYKQVYKTDNYNVEVAKPFLDAIKTVVYNSRLIPRFSFYPDGAKAVFVYHEQEITVEYDFDEPTSVFVSKFIGDILNIKDTTIDDLSKALGAFL